ncbi:MAG TPA: hypothetical protein VFD36_02440 [Kofleriaceae bacterium]|nr:hypothetical protein [Kofleriaceae bacterium]
MAVWPASLPEIPLVAGFSESPPNTLIRTQMDAGPARVRPRYTGGPRPMKAAISCTAAQVETFDVFLLTTLLQGSQKFDWVHPRTGIAKTFRFVIPPDPTYVPEHKDRWTVSFQLEVMP